MALEKHCFGSAAILILSAIDAMAFLSMPEARDDVTRGDFIAWADKYIRFPGSEQLTGVDLYGARCAMLHCYGVRSRMSRRGECRMVGYMDESTPPIRFNPEVSKELVLVSLPALRDAVFQGIDRFLIDLFKNPNSEEARTANDRLNTLVGEFPTAEL